MDTVMLNPMAVVGKFGGIFVHFFIEPNPKNADLAAVFRAMPAMGGSGVRASSTVNASALLRKEDGYFRSRSGSLPRCS